MLTPHPVQYCSRMREDGTWGGNQELYAAARLFQVYVVVHMESSRMVIECDAQKPKKVIHVAYHGEDHYDSVRSIKESDERAYEGEPPMEIEIDCDGFRPQDLAKVCLSHSVWLLSSAVGLTRGCSDGRRAGRTPVASSAFQLRPPPATTTRPTRWPPSSPICVWTQVSRAWR